MISIWATYLIAFGTYTFGCVLTYLLYRPKIKLGEALMDAKDDGELHDVKDEAQ